MEHWMHFCRNANRITFVSWCGHKMFCLKLGRNRHKPYEITWVTFVGDSEIDQLFKIFQVRGTPDKKVWFKVEDLPDYAHSFPQWGRKPLNQVIPHGSDLAIHLLDVRYDFLPNEI
jgi:hypothetical protein